MEPFLIYCLKMKSEDDGQQWTTMPLVMPMMESKTIPVPLLIQKLLSGFHFQFVPCHMVDKKLVLSFPKIFCL